MNHNIIKKKKQKKKPEPTNHFTTCQQPPTVTNQSEDSQVPGFKAMKILDNKYTDNKLDYDDISSPPLRLQCKSNIIVSSHSSLKSNAGGIFHPASLLQGSNHKVPHF